MKNDYQEIDKLFFDEGYRLASECLNEGVTAENIIMLIAAVNALSDNLIETFSSKVEAEEQIIDCQKGCHWCCAQTVYANPLEIYVLTEFIRKRFSKKKQDLFLKKAIEKDRITSALDEKGKLKHRQFCPFLKDKGSCAVYDARPTACRIYLSMDLESCREDWENPKNRKIFPQLYSLPLHAGRMINEGIAIWLAEKNLYLNEDTLEAGFIRFLKNENALNEWLDANKK
jgi:Fe-S-cluster containining protein